MADAYVALLLVHLHFPEAGSLKAKRKDLASVKAQLHGRMGVTVAEVDLQATSKLRDEHKDKFKKAGVPPTRVRREVALKAGGDPLKAGDQVNVSIFADGERVDVIGTSRGKGFQGVVKRHHFAGGAATHGSMFHRAPGSIGASSFPSRRACPTLSWSTATVDRAAARAAHSA